MKKIFALICIVGLVLGASSCNDPNEDIFYDADHSKVSSGETGGSVGNEDMDVPPKSTVN